MIKVGLTGGIGSGKSTVAKIFAMLEIPVYSADVEAKKILQKASVVQKIAETFGVQVLENKTSVDKRRLADLVFNNQNALSKLNSIIHPAVKKDFESWTAQNSKHHYIIQEAAILFESGFDTLFDKIISVSASKELRINRVTTRDGVGKQDVRLRMENQWNDRQRSEKSDFIIYNNESDLLIPQVLQIHEQLLKL